MVNLKGNKVSATRGACGTPSNIEDGGFKSSVVQLKLTNNCRKKINF